MAAPVVAGTVALMLQANPQLTPNGVKAILQYTAQEYPGYDALTQGAGFLNAVGAVRLAQFFATARPGQPVPLQKMWSKKIIWGNHRLSGGILEPDGQRLPGRDDLGRDRHRRWGQHRMGHRMSRWLRQHRVGYRRS